MKRVINTLKYYLIKIFLKRFFAPFKLKSGAKLTVGKMSYHNGSFNISGDQYISIGSYCAIGKNVSIITSNHDYNYACIQGTFYTHFFGIQHPGVTKSPPNPERTKGDVRIGSDVWISHNVTILSGVTIGNGVCIANNSVVTKDIDAYTIVGGIPAKEIKKRYSNDKIVFLEDTKWWDWDANRIIKNKDFFTVDLNKIDLNEIKKIIQ